MKKIITMTVAVAMTAMAFGAEYARLNTLTSTIQDYRAVANALLQAKDAAEARSIEIKTKFVGACIYAKLPVSDIALEVDNALGAKGYFISSAASGTKTFPKLSAISCQENGYDTNGVLFALARKYNCDAAPFFVFGKSNDFEEAISLLNACVRDNFTTIETIIYIKRTFQTKFGLKLVKKMLYRQGKSFVTGPDGKNPCEDMMTSLTASLNAARMSGFNEWLAQVGVTNRVDMSFLPSQQEIATLKQKVLEGDVDASFPVVKNIYLGLSIEDYNAFIKKYNGEN